MIIVQRTGAGLECRIPVPGLIGGFRGGSGGSLEPPPPPPPGTKLFQFHGEIYDKSSKMLKTNPLWMDLSPASRNSGSAPVPIEERAIICKDVYIIRVSLEGVKKLCIDFSNNQKLRYVKYHIDRQFPVFRHIYPPPSIISTNPYSPQISQTSRQVYTIKFLTIFYHAYAVPMLINFSWHCLLKV